MYVHMYVYIHIYIYANLHACIYMCMFKTTYLHVHVNACCMSVACLPACPSLSQTVSLSVFLSVCMRRCMYVCECVRKVCVQVHCYGTTNLLAYAQSQHVDKHIDTYRQGHAHQKATLGMQTSDPNQRQSVTTGLHKGGFNARAGC